LGKTETIKERAIYVYLSSIEQKESWKERAKKQGTSVSKFVIECVEDSLGREEDVSYKSRGDLWKEIRELREQLDKMAKEKRVLEIAFDRLEKELRRYRAQPFLEENFSGVRRYQRELVDILREGRVIRSDEILRRIGIQPSEHEVIKAISNQLENLESYGLVQSSSKGWRWRN
jgi:hypothetical protein